MKKFDARYFVLLCLLIGLPLFIACGPLEEDADGDGSADGDAVVCDPSADCCKDSDCPELNATCNVVGGGVCVNHGGCASDSQCEQWFDLAKPYCNSGGACELYCDHCEGENPDGDEGGNPDGDAPVEGCNDFTGFYDGEFTCGGSVDIYDTWVAADYLNCSIYIIYEDKKLTGGVSGSDISINGGKKCSGSGVIAGQVTLSCQDGCEIILTPKTPDPEDPGTAKGKIRVQPSEHNFGAVQPGSVGQALFNFTNEGEGEFEILDLFFTEDTSNEFEIVDSEDDWALPKTFAYGGHDELQVDYTPTTEAARQGMIIVISNALNQQVTRIKLISEVKASPKIETDPTVVDFGCSPHGFQNSRYFLAKNIGAASANVTNIRLANDANGAYTLELTQDSTPPLWIEAGYSVPVNLNFTPIDGVHAVGTNLVGQVCIDWKDREENDVETCVDLIGCVSDLEPPCIKMDPLEGVPGFLGMGELPGPGIKFGYSQIDTFTTREFAITNCGDLPLQINNLMWNEMLTGPPFSFRAFAEEPGAFSNYTINRGQTIYLPVTYYPVSEGVLNTAGFLFGTNAEWFDWLGGPQPPDMPPEFAGLVAVGVSGIGARRGIEVLPSKLDFGVITLDCCSRPEEITVYNIGDLALEISEIIIGAGSDERFELVGLPDANDFPLFLGGDGNPQKQRFKVKFCPTFEGEHNGRVEIKSNDANAGEFIVPLRGEGTLLTHQRDEFEQNTHPIVDVMWVIDCSGSMSEEQDKVEEQTDYFVREAVNWNADLHLSVVSCDITSQTGHKGLMHGSPAVLDNTVMNNNDIINKFNDRVNFPGGCDSGEQEAGLEGAHLALTEPLISNENAGFIREEAKLAIIFLSDEDDQSVAEVPFFIDFFRSIKGMRNVNMIEVYAIVGDKPDGCSSGSGDTADSAGQGPRYIAVGDACNVHDDLHFYSICEPDYKPVFDNLAENLFALHNQFFLSRLADESTIVVTVNGTLSNEWEYDEISNSILFDPDGPPGPGSTIVVEYDTVCLH